MDMTGRGPARRDRQDFQDRLLAGDALKIAPEQGLDGRFLLRTGEIGPGPSPGQYSGGE
jgi:hypothetical protein